ncbi:hypothetical protein HAX54_007988, partial [Datura stramonium]|nr:hypothetical protein [Datura stramonium]
MLERCIGIVGWILKQQRKELSQPQFDDYAEISSPNTDSSVTEPELLEDIFLATLFTEKEGDVCSKFGRDVATPYMFDEMPERDGTSRNNVISDFAPSAS